jgi:hypothetical protein
MRRKLVKLGKWYAATFPLTMALHLLALQNPQPQIGKINQSFKLALQIHRVSFTGSRGILDSILLVLRYTTWTFSIQ